MSMGQISAGTGGAQNARTRAFRRLGRTCRPGHLRHISPEGNREGRRSNRPSMFDALSIFALRPLVAQSENYNFYGLDAYPGAGFALKAGTMGLVFFALGCLLGSRHRERTASVDLVQVDNDALKRAGRRVLLVALVGASLTLAVLILFGGPKAVGDFLLHGRSSALNQLLANLPTFFSMIGFLGSAAASAYLALRSRVSARLAQREVWLLAAAVGVSFLLNVSTGSRRALIPIVLVPLSVTFFVRKGAIPTRLLIFGGIAVLFFATLPFVRSEGARPQSNVFSASATYASGGGISAIAKGFFLSYDTEMFNYVAFVGPRVGNSLPAGNGRATFGELLTFPLPESLLPNANYSDQMLTHLYGGGCGDPVCPVPSAIGVFLMDFGLLGVALG